MSIHCLGYWTHHERPPSPPVLPLVATAKRLDEDGPLNFQVLGPKNWEGGRTGRTKWFVLQTASAVTRF
jgi:hypothetical protein